MMVRAVENGYLLSVAGHFVAHIGNRMQARKIAARYRAAGDVVKITRHGKELDLE